MNTKQRKFAEGVAVGDLPAEAYAVAYGVSGESARVAASRLLRNVTVQRMIREIRAEAAKIGGSAVLTLVEKREFLARAVRDTLSMVGADDPLAVKVKVSRPWKKDGDAEQPELWETVEVTKVDPVAAIALDSKLVGDGAPDEVKVSGLGDLVKEIRNRGKK